jgi:hypothetical protein
MLFSEGFSNRRRQTAASHHSVFICGLPLGLFLISIPGVAQDRDNGSAESKKDPPRIVFTLPMEFDFDHGAQNGNAVINRYLPLVVFPLGEEWQLVNLTLATIADAPGGVPGRPGNPEPAPGEQVLGLGDLTNAALLTPPTRSMNLVWGFGPAVTIPIATDDRLGSGKWSLGPAFRIAYRPGPWNLGAVVADLGSFAGDSERGDVHQLLVRGLIRRRFGDGWYFTHNPIITANWKASSGQRWLVPVGGGIGKRFELGSKSVALSIHYYANVVRPKGAPSGLFRVDIVLPIPGSPGG